MTHQEKLKNDIDLMNVGGGVSHNAWEMFLLTSIADSLAAIADCLNEKEAKDADN